MGHGWLESRVNLRNKHQMHLRPAQRIVETAQRFRADVRVNKDGREFNAKSILDLIEFVYHMAECTAQDDYEFVFRAQGPDAADVLAALNLLVDDRFGLD